MQFSSERFKYIVSKPLHTSQKIIDEYKCIVTIKVIPTRELDQLILAFGPDVEVLAPDKYRMSIKTKIVEMSQQISLCALRLHIKLYFYNKQI